jgi:hypothetical protein
LRGGDAENVTAATSIASTEHKSIQSVEKMIQELFHPDNAKVNATLDALHPDLQRGQKKCGSLVTAGVCFVLILFMKNCLDKAIEAEFQLVIKSPG